MEVFGFSSHDALLLFFCPIFAVIGGMIHFYVLFGDYSKLPEDVSFNTLRQIVGRVAWLIARLFLSWVAGLVLGLFLVGAFTNTPTTFARIFAFSILIGYAAPKLWIIQEAIVKDSIEKRLKILEEQTK